MKKTLAALLAAAAVFSCALSALAFPPSGGTLYNGIDVSQWQGEIDFAQVSSSGVDIVYIRAGEGADFTDPYCLKNYEGARSAGLKTGFYHYVTARTEEEARSQAAYFASIIRGLEPDCRVAMDFEELDGLTPEEATSIALAFLEETERLSQKQVMLYADAYDAKAYFEEPLTQCPLWVADYGVQEPAENGRWESWAGFQYSASGSVPGVDGDVDLDYFTDAVFLPESLPPTGEISLYYSARASRSLREAAALLQRFCRR